MKSQNKGDIEICVGINRKNLCDEMNKCLPFDDQCETQVMESYQNKKLNCPCMSNCPDGCPCPSYECGATTTTTASTTTTTTTTTAKLPAETKDWLIKCDITYII